MHDKPWILTPDEIRFLKGLFGVLTNLRDIIDTDTFDAFLAKLDEESSRY